MPVCLDRKSNQKTHFVGLASNRSATVVPYISNLIYFLINSISFLFTKKRKNRDKNRPPWNCKYVLSNIFSVACMNKNSERALYSKERGSLEVVELILLPFA